MRQFFYSIILVFTVMLQACGMGKVARPIGNLFSKENTTYRIKKPYDLGGAKLTIPKNCTLVFTKEGRLYNGDIEGNNTKLKGDSKSIGVRLSGTWNVKQFADEWFDDSKLTDREILDNINALQSDELTQVITLNKKEYKFPIEEKNGYGINMSSNTTLYLNSTLKLETRDLTTYNIIFVKDKKNVKIVGGKIIGDVVAHSDYYEGKSEWGTGVDIGNSTNVTLEDMYITLCWGDGVYVGGGAEKKVGIYDYASKNVKLKNVICDNNRRQGISITHVDGFLAENCQFINTGVRKKVSPAAGVDIEPNLNKGRNQSCRNMTFKKCVMKGNRGKVFTIYMSVTEGDVNNIENIYLYDCDIEGRISLCSPSIEIEKCRIDALLTVRTYQSPVKVRFTDCVIKSDNVAFDMEPKKEVKPKYDVTFKDCDLTIRRIKDALPALQGDNNIRVTFDNTNIAMPKSLSKQITSNKPALDKNLKLVKSGVNYE